MILNRTYSDPTAPSSSNGELMTRTESNVSLMQEDNSNSGPPISFAMNNDECGQGDVSTQQQTSPGMDGFQGHWRDFFGGYWDKDGGKVKFTFAAISPNITASQAQDLASTFVKWFYDMMNNAFASPESSTEGEFRRDHFFPDASAKICLQPATCDANVQPGGHQYKHSWKWQFVKLIALYRTNLCSKFWRRGPFGYGRAPPKISPYVQPQLVPGRREGHNGRTWPHDGQCLWNSAQQFRRLWDIPPTSKYWKVYIWLTAFIASLPPLLQFGLVRDPYEGNNWKIKFTYANLVSKAAVSEAPRLENFSQEQGASNGTTAMALSWSKHWEYGYWK